MQHIHWLKMYCGSAECIWMLWWSACKAHCIIYAHYIIFTHYIMFFVCPSCRGGEFKLGCYTLSVPPHQLTHLLQSGWWWGGGGHIISYLHITLWLCNIYTFELYTRYVLSTHCSMSMSNRCVLAQSVERPPHNREVVGSIPGRVIPKDVKRWELLLPCLAFNIWKG